MAVAFRLRSRGGISEWSVDQVCDFLEVLELFDLRETVRREAINGRVLCEISEEELAGPPFNLTFGARKALMKELSQQRQRDRCPRQGPILSKQHEVVGPELSHAALDRVKHFRLEASTGRLVRRHPPLSDAELECWQYQASWLVCPITGKAWARSDVVSTMGVALYHAPRFCSEREKQRLFVEEEQARRYDAERKALMDHSGTSFEKTYEIYPVVEAPPLANLPMESMGSEQLQQLRAEVIGLKGRSADVQRQMFEGLVQGEEDVEKALQELKVEPLEEAELARKFAVYESYFSGVVALRAELFGLWERGERLLAAPEPMRAQINRVDNFDNLAIPERSRHWFVYHMMSTASKNHQKMQTILDELEELFEAQQDAGTSDELTDDPQLGAMEVIIGPAFDIDAYNDGVKGNPSKGILPAAERGILDMDRQYNAVNFQFFAQQAEAGVTRVGAEASYKRRLCTSRLSFYLEESHGSRIFPRNILSQLSLLFYRRNDALRLPNGRVNEPRVAVCVRKAMPRMLRAIVLDVFQGDRNFAPHVEKAVRVYLALHQVAIKLLATFRKSYELLYQSVLEWIQQPFCPKSDTEWPDLEELLLGSSLCSLPWSLLREAFVRKLFVYLMENTAVNPKAPARQRLEHMFNQHRNFLERLGYILSFFQAGPGKLSIQEMDAKYCRCAGTLPEPERQSLIQAAKESSSKSLLELWSLLGMQRSKDTDEVMVLQHIEHFLEHVQREVSAWRLAPAPSTSEGPALPPRALEQLASIGAQALHVDRVGRKEQLAAEKALHRGFPKLPPSRRLDGTMCYYCQKRFPSRMALFAHLRRLIEKDHFIEGHHQHHFQLKVPGPEQLSGTRCAAAGCGRSYSSTEELKEHYCTMGVPGYDLDLTETGPENVLEEDAGWEVVDAPVDLSKCAVCLDRPADVVMVPCGHIFACQACGQKLKECALCRASVSRVLKVYYSS